MRSEGVDLITRQVVHTARVIADTSTFEELNIYNELPNIPSERVAVTQIVSFFHVIHDEQLSCIPSGRDTNGHITNSDCFFLADRVNRARLSFVVGDRDCRCSLIDREPGRRDPHFGSKLLHAPRVIFALGVCRKRTGWATPTATRTAAAAPTPTG
jgi:hypothetical protein